MPGRPATDQQMRQYMDRRRHHPQRVAAAKAGLSERTGRRIEDDPRLAYRAAWERLIDTYAPRIACRIMVELLALAHDAAAKLTSPRRWQSNCTTVAYPTCRSCVPGLHRPPRRCPS